MSEDRGQLAETEEFDLAEEALDDPEAEEAIDSEDEGVEGDEGDQVREGSEGQGDVTGQRRPSRGARRIASLSERSRRAEQENVELRGRLAALEARQQNFQPDPYAAQRAAEAEQAEAARIAQLPYEDQIRYWRDRDRREVTQQLNRQQFLISDQLDRQGFDALARSDPIAARLKDQVEQLRIQNPTIPREAILNHLYGQEMRQKAERATAQQRRAGARRIARETTQLGGARSTGQATAGRGRDDSIEAVRGRLRGVQF